MKELSVDHLIKIEMILAFEAGDAGIQLAITLFYLQNLDEFNRRYYRDGFKLFKAFCEYHMLNP